VGGAEGALDFYVVFLDEVVESTLLEGYVHHLTLAHEDIEELLGRRVGDVELVLDPTEEGVINQVLGAEVGGEDQEKLEGDL
jgi:hypothetical protein